MKNLTPEMIEKAKAAKSAEELLEVAKAGGVELTADEAATYFAQLNPKSGELDDDALDGVAGGCGGSGDNSQSNEALFPVGCKVREYACKQCGKNVYTVEYHYIGYACGLVLVCDNCSVLGTTYNLNASNMADHCERID